MIRGFFYSLILHIFTFLFIFYGYLADKIKIENAVKYIEIGVNSDFFKENKIKTTERSLYEHLDLRSKINLYNLAKKFINNKGNGYLTFYIFSRRFYYAETKADAGSGRNYSFKL